MSKINPSKFFITQRNPQKVKLRQKNLLDRNEETYKKECIEIFIRYTSEKEKLSKENLEYALKYLRILINGINITFKSNNKNFLMGFSLQVGLIDHENKLFIMENLLKEIGEMELPCYLLPILDSNGQGLTLKGCLKIPEHLMEIIEANLFITKAVAMAYRLREYFVLSI